MHKKGLNRRILGNAEVETAEATAMDPDGLFFGPVRGLKPTLDLWQMLCVSRGNVATFVRKTCSSAVTTK